MNVLRRFLPLVAILFVPPPLLARDATATIRIPPIALEVQMLMAEEEFTTETMVLDSNTILDRYKDMAFLRIQFAVSLRTLNSDLPDGISNRGIWALTKEHWNARTVRYGELLSVRGNAVLRIRDGLAIQTIVIRGENPLLVSYEGRKAEFVHYGLLYNYSKTAVLWIDASAAVKTGELDAAFAKHVAQAAQQSLNASLTANLLIGEDRFCVFTGRFATSLLFDLDAPPPGTDWQKIRRAECGVNRFGQAFCRADPPASLNK